MRLCNRLALSLNLRSLLPTIAFLVLVLAARADRVERQMPGYRMRSDLPAPRARVNSVDEIMPAARDCLRQALGLKPGERAVIVADSSVPVLVVEAFRRAIGEAGGSALVRMAGECRQRAEEADGCRDGKSSADAVILLSFTSKSRSVMGAARLGQALGTRPRRIEVFAVPELLASQWGRFPLELMEAIAQRSYRKVQGGGVARLTDPAGSELEFNFVPVADSQPARRAIKASFDAAFPFNYRVAIRPVGASRGVLVVHRAAGRAIPLLRMELSDGCIAAVEGGGAFGSSLREKLSGSRYCLKEISWYTNPKPFRYVDGYSGSAWRWGDAAAARRAGVVHLSFALAAGSGSDSASRRGPTLESFDVSIFFPTLAANGERIIEDGFLPVLAEPEVLSIAARYGGPGLLLQTCVPLDLPSLPQPRSPAVKKATSVDQLLPAARNCIAQWAAVKASDKVLLLTDSSVPPLVDQAFKQAIEEVGARLNIEQIEAPAAPLRTAPALEWLNNKAIPAELKLKLEQSDLIIATTAWLPWNVEGEALEAWLKKNRRRLVRVLPVPELLASPWSLYPRPLLVALRDEVAGLASSASTLLVKDHRGTDLTVDISKVESADEGSILHFPPNFYQRALPATIGYKTEAVVQGTAVVSTALAGPMLTARLKIKEGRLVEVEDGGDVGRLLRLLIDKFKSIEFGVFPGPGAHWLEEVGWYLCPKAFPYTERSDSSSGTLAGHIGGLQRSGVVHIVFGSGGAEGKGALRQRYSFQIYFPTVVLVGAEMVKEIIESGHLMALDAPGVKAKAVGFGAPEALLSEDWIPAVAGANVK